MFYLIVGIDVKGVKYLWILVCFKCARRKWVGQKIQCQFDKIFVLFKMYTGFLNAGFWDLGSHFSEKSVYCYSTLSTGLAHFYDIWWHFLRNFYLGYFVSFLLCTLFCLDTFIQTLLSRFVCPDYIFLNLSGLLWLDSFVWTFCFNSFV